MAATSKDYRYTVEFNIHVVDAPGTRLKQTGDLYINICLLGIHKRTRLTPPYLPIHFDQRLHFEKVFKFCGDSSDIMQRLEREHILIELIQNDLPSPVVLASHEASARDFLYSTAWDRVDHVGLRRYVLLSRTLDFPGISPTFEFSTSSFVDDVTGLQTTRKSRRQPHEVRIARSARFAQSSSSANRRRSDTAASLSRSFTAHTVSSAVKNDHGQPEIQEKLRTLAVDRDIHYVSPVDKTKGRPPFVVRHVNANLIQRMPQSHDVLSEGLVINDYTLARPDLSTSLNSFDAGDSRSRSLSPVIGRSINLSRTRTRSPSPSRRSPTFSRSIDFESLRSPSRRLDDDQLRYTDTHFNSSSRRSLSPTLHRDSFRYRHRYSPASDLSDKVIHTLRRNLDSYSAAPWHRYYSPYRSSYGYISAAADDDVL